MPFLSFSLAYILLFLGTKNDPYFVLGSPVHVFFCFFFHFLHAVQRSVSLIVFPFCCRLPSAMETTLAAFVKKPTDAHVWPTSACKSWNSHMRVRKRKVYSIVERTAEIKILSHLPPFTSLYIHADITGYTHTHAQIRTYPLTHIYI